MSHVDEMPRLRAARLLDAASASVAQFQKQPWWDSLERRAYADADDGQVSEAAPAPALQSAFRWNGVAMDVDTIKQNIAGALGAGFQAA